MTLDIRSHLTCAACLPADAPRALLIGRAWIPAVKGPMLVRVDGDGLFDLSAIAPTASELLNRPDVARDPSLPWLLAPCDLQAIKASGVTFVASMLERVIEEQARGDPARADG